MRQDGARADTDDRGGHQYLQFLPKHSAVTRVMYHSGERVRNVQGQRDRQPLDDGNTVEGRQPEQDQGAATDTEDAGEDSGEHTESRIGP